MPTITPANALIRAADYLSDAIAGLVPTPTCTMNAVNQLMIIFKQQAHEANDAATAQRVLRERAQAERVIEEEQQESDTPEPAQARITSPPIFKHNKTNDSPALPQRIPQITQDEYDDYNPPPHQRQNRRPPGVLSSNETPQVQGCMDQVIRKRDKPPRHNHGNHLFHLKGRHTE